MKMQTMRNLMGEPETSTPAPRSTALLPPLAAFATGPMVRVEPKPVFKDMAQKKAGEAYLNMMAGVAFRAQFQG